jgi:hypothetical protein
MLHSVGKACADRYCDGQMAAKICPMLDHVATLSHSMVIKILAAIAVAFKRDVATR